MVVEDMIKECCANKTSINNKPLHGKEQDSYQKIISNLIYEMYKPSQENLSSGNLKKEVINDLLSLPYILHEDTINKYLTIVFENFPPIIKEN